MIEKIELKGTYAYKNFIDDEIKQTLLSWTDTNYQSFIVNPKSFGRRYKLISSDDSIHELVLTIKNKIIELENITDWKKEPVYDDFIGVNSEGSSIHNHTDKNYGDYIHTRWNLILSYPEDGGHSIYGDNINILEENLIWKCVAGKYSHGSTKVIGKKPRITLSIGFLIKETK
jgi:hypothetical protein